MRRALGVIGFVLLAGCSSDNPGTGGPDTASPSFPVLQAGVPAAIVGVDTNGVTHHQPSSWPSAAGTWNGKGARYNRATQKLVFESFRADIVGGSIQTTATGSTAPGVTEYYAAGPGTGTSSTSGTSELYVSDPDGSNASCIGCTDVQDGQNGVAIYKAQLTSASSPPAAPTRQSRAFVYANQNKDLAAWSPDGNWIFATIEMPTHALTHLSGNGEVGSFNDIWAISADGKTWVQLTDFQSAWQFKDTTNAIPYACADSTHCTVGCYCNAGSQTTCSASTKPPFSVYFCSAAGASPPAIGAMRPTTGNQSNASGQLPIAWGENVGFGSGYPWGQVQQLATAEISFADSLPSLVLYQRNLTPTPTSPQGTGLWNNPAGTTVIGTGYEPWAFSGDNQKLLFASDAFFSTSHSAASPAPGPVSQLFPDVVQWSWLASPWALVDETAYDAGIYPYQNNGSTCPAGDGPIEDYGHWEEPATFSESITGPELIAFASSANISPAWDPCRFAPTFGLETWVMPADRSKSAVMVTAFNGTNHYRAYPTSTDPEQGYFYLSVEPGGGSGGSNPPGSIWAILFPAF